jgi:hypothetical protein
MRPGLTPGFSSLRVILLRTGSFRNDSADPFEFEWLGGKDYLKWLGDISQRNRDFSETELTDTDSHCP